MKLHKGKHIQKKVSYIHKNAIIAYTDLCYSDCNDKLCAINLFLNYF